MTIARNQENAPKGTQLPYVIRRSIVSAELASGPYAQMEAFFAQLESLYRVVNALAVALSAAGSWLALYFDTPSQ